MGWGVEDKSFFLLNVPLVMQKKKKNKRKKINPWVFFFFTPLLTLLESLLSQRFLFHKLCAFNIPIEQSRTPVLLF